MIKFILKLIINPSFRRDARPLIDTIDVVRKLRAYARPVIVYQGYSRSTGDGECIIKGCYTTGDPLHSIKNIGRANEKHGEGI